MSTKVTIIGAGSVVFSLGLVKDLCLTPGMKGSKVCFMDINAQRLDVVYRLAIRYAEDLGADLTFDKTLDREAALQEADFVINTATVTHNEHFMKRRRELAAEHGYFYGRTGMPEYHNLQMMLDVARDMERICPDAWLLLAGNPVFDGSTLMTRQTGIKVCGLCHGHYGYQQIARVIGLDPDKVTWQAPGLNHNIWLTDFYHEGEDAYPLLDAWIVNESETYWRENDNVSAQLSPSAIHQYRMYGLMPVGDTPRRGGWWYHVDLETRARWYGGDGGGDTPAGRDKILEGKQKKFQQMKEAAFDAQARPVEMFGDQMTTEQHVPIIDGLINDNEGQFQVNVPNQGALAGIPDDVVVELPAIVNKKGIQPLRVPPLPRKILLECLYPDWLQMERTVEALLTGDLSMMLFGVLENHQTRSYEQAMEVMDALLQIEPNEPMAHVEDINEHYSWPHDSMRES
ncbi:MAG: alpha-glucosidase/alpha-galactosidase [Gemmatimonadetes bacterium]|jgi:alpha-galactosidase|nr:alpha-glucosidase/alpha-galactosidase [Gemmatimonadota bacterium]MBT7860840.1 alpha-glucosidase/alpha-galactosidase [Gemmatimonadota bacterium]